MLSRVVLRRKDKESNSIANENFYYIRRMEIFEILHLLLRSNCYYSTKHEAKLQKQRHQII